MSAGIVHGMPDTEYHSRPELSSTGLRLLLPQYKGSPKKFRYAQSHPRTSRVFDVGSAVHSKVLGVGAGIIEYPDEHLTPSGNVSTKAATVAWEQEQRAAGLIPVSPAEIERVDAAAEAVLAHETAAPILEVAEHREVSVFAELDGVPVRARFDALSGETRRGVIASDLKSCLDATKAGFERSVSKWGYDVQEVHYEDTYNAATGRPINEFYFIAVELTPPFEVAVHHLPVLWRESARKRAAQARAIFRECMESGKWPGYDPMIRELDMPAWRMYEDDDELEVV